MIYFNVSCILILLPIIGYSNAQTTDKNQSKSTSYCQVCSNLTESQCLSTMKEIVKLMDPMDRIHSMSSFFKPGMCSDKSAEECADATEQEIMNIGWNTLTKNLKDDCEAGKVVLSSPAIMQFSFSSIYEADEHLSTTTRNTYSKNLISKWKNNCSLCNSIPDDLNYDKDDQCAEQILSTFVKLTNIERFDIFRSVFSKISCSKLANSDDECLAVFDGKLYRADDKDRKAFAFKACSGNLIPESNLRATTSNNKTLVQYVPSLVSKCAACLESDTAQSCTDKMFKGLFSMNDRDRLATFKNGLLSESMALKLCKEGKLESSEGCLKKYDNYFKMVKQVKLEKGSASDISNIDLSLLESCAAGKLPDLVTNPLKKAYEKAYSHKGGVEAAINDWKGAIAQNKQNLKNNSLLRSSSKDGSSCLYCTALSDKDCLATLDQLVYAVSDSVLFSVYESIFPNDAQLCAMGYKGTLEQCFNALKAEYDSMTDKERLAALLVTCEKGILNKSFKPKNFVYEQNLAQIDVQSTPFDETIGPILMFALSATLALFLGMMVSHIIRKKSITRKTLRNHYRMGPIHEYTSLDG